MPIWDKYSYCETFKNIFSQKECDQIIALHESHEVKPSELLDANGAKLRDSHLFWLRRTDENRWLFERVERVITSYNETYNFDILGEAQAAQLTRYSKGQKYGWHVDLGANRSSLRKITAVVELSSKLSRVGGGTEIFYGETLRNQIDLNIGDIIVFPSFVTHRASEVKAGMRWSLVFWFLGTEPFR